MRAVGLTKYLPIENPESLMDVELPDPTPTGHDLLVRIKAIAVNPVDCKVRAPKDKVESTPRVLGWDAAGVVVAVGSEASLFHAGDHVFYAGDVTRPGCNAELQLVDERLVGAMPTTLTFEESAALPLTALTAYEALFVRLCVPKSPSAPSSQTLLIIGGAGGVGSIAIQLAKQVAQLTVIATASRPQSVDWCRRQGADHVVNHHQDLVQQVRSLGYEFVDHVLILNDTDGHFPAAAELVAPQGKICSIVENNRSIGIDKLRSKSAQFLWEFMFTRSMYRTPDMIEQHRILNDVSRLVDDRILKSTLNRVLGPIDAKHLKLAHAEMEKGCSVGKLVLSGFLK
jgi:zinc-binding alcohol dehydrogenase family protein